MIKVFIYIELSEPENYRLFSAPRQCNEWIYMSTCISHFHLSYSLSMSNYLYVNIFVPVVFICLSIYPSYLCSHLSIYKSTSLSVSESVCLFVCLFPNSSETANPSDLKFWWMIPLGMQNDFGQKNFWIRWTVSWKIACILAPHSTLVVNFILSNVNV